MKKITKQKIIPATWVTMALVVVLANLSCSTNKKVSKPLEADEAERARAPQWVYAPDEGCSPLEICAAGEGESMQQADIRAKKSLASVFGVKIQSQFDIHKTSYTDEEISQLKEFVSSEVGETVNEVLKGAEIKKRFQKDGLYFSLASLEKRKAQNSINQEVKAIDDELEHLYSLRRKSSVKRMLTLLEKRALLSDKLVVLKGQGPPAPLKFSQVQNLKYSKQGYDKVYIRSSASVPATLKKHFEQILSESGYKSKEDLAVDYLIELKFDAKEAYLNVKGFKKFLFSFTVEARNNIKEKIGSFTVTETSSGRGKEDAFLRAKPKIKKEIEKKLSKLNLK